MLRGAVRERRNRRRGREPSAATTEIAQRVEEIVQLLENAACVLRPRETQELDDLVAGKEPAEPTAGYTTPVRLHRRGAG
jgi:hypothetical protein